MASEYPVNEELEIIEAGPVATLFRTDEPTLVIARATEMANELARVIRSQGLFARIGNKDHVLVEGWTLAGTLLGVFPVLVWTRPLEGGWEARVEARTRDGAIVGAAESMCLRAEKEWGPNPTRGKPREDYALRSMAQTRATSKALRQPLGFVITLAGFAATPAEEMPEASAADKGLSHPERVDAVAATPAPAAAEDAVVDDGKFPPPGVEEGLTEAQAGNLNRLVGQLRDHGFITTDQLWKSVGRQPEPSEDGEIHWSPLRDTLTKAEAHALIDRLQAYENQVAPGGFYIPKKP